MEEFNDASTDNVEEMVKQLEEVYENAYRALQYGATKECLLDQIDYALEMYQEAKQTPGACQKCGQV